MESSGAGEDSHQAMEAPAAVDEALVDATLFRLTEGLPQSELRLIVSESDECEELLGKDIELLEKALDYGDGGDDDKKKKADYDEDALDDTVDSLLTPLDRFWTASALLGRLRGPLAVQQIPTLQQSGIVPPPPRPSPAEDERTQQLSRDLLDLAENPLYTEVHESPANLLALHKKIAMHRASAVFKRAVKQDEAPGYADRILYPMDLSLIRKMVVARQITTYQQFHRHVALISHDCVKFNGRESDYGLVAREFEVAADEAIRQVVLGITTRKTPTPRPPSADTTQAAAAAPAAPSDEATTAATDT